MSYRKKQKDNFIEKTSKIFIAGHNCLVGSSCIYPKNAPQPISEDALLSGKFEPTNEPYALAKIAGIIMCQSYNRQYGTNFISVI